MVAKNCFEISQCSKCHRSESENTVWISMQNKFAFNTNFSNRPKKINELDKKDVNFGELSMRPFDEMVW